MTLFAWVRLLLRWLVAGAVVCLPGRGVGQVTSATGVLAEMAARAGVIFTGLVVEIGRADAQGFVDVRFRVEQPVRGLAEKTTSGSSYVLREWAGLWTAGDRYRVGQRFLMLLNARGSSGMSAPVDGMDGAIPLLGGGEMPLVRGTAAAPADTTLAEAETLVDLRWLAAKALRTVSVSSGAEPGARQTAAATGSERVVATGDPELGPEPETSPQGAGAPVLVGRPVLGGTAALGWVGPVAPLPGSGSTATSGAAAGGVKLSAVLAILTDGAAHVGR